MLPSTRPLCTVSSLPRRSAFGTLSALVTPIWWCSNAQATRMQKMRTWQATTSWYNSSVDILRGVSFTMCREQTTKQQMHCPSLAQQDKPFHQAYHLSTSGSRSEERRV